MKRKIIAGMLGLAVAGCAHSRSEIPKETKRPLGPVGITPVPPIDQTINRGVGNPAVSQATLRDAEDSRWSGRAPAPAQREPGNAPGDVSLAQGSPAAGAPGLMDGPPGPSNGPDTRPMGPHDVGNLALRERSLKPRRWPRPQQAAAC